MNVGAMATTILVAIMVLTIQALTMLEGPTYWVPFSVALMVLTMLIYADFRVDDESTRSWVLGSAIQALGAGLMAYIILSPVTYEVENANFVMAYIVTLVFWLAYFDFGIEMDERRAKELK